VVVHLKLFGKVSKCCNDGNEEEEQKEDNVNSNTNNLTLKEESNNGYLEKDQILEGARYGKCKYFLVKQINENNDMKYFTLFSNRSPIMYYKEYLTNGALTYSFCLSNDGIRST